MLMHLSIYWNLNQYINKYKKVWNRQKSDITVININIYDKQDWINWKGVGSGSHFISYSFQIVKAWPVHTPANIYIIFINVESRRYVFPRKKLNSFIINLRLSRTWRDYWSSIVLINSFAILELSILIILSWELP